MNSILNNFMIKKDVDDMIKTKFENFEKSINALKSYMLEELKKVTQETDNLKINLNENKNQLINLDENICKIKNQKADLYQVNEIYEELKKIT